MDHAPEDVMFSASVKQQQEQRGSRGQYAAKATRGLRTAISEDLLLFLAQRDSFYLGTVSGDGQPYIQHRGGPKGFIKVLGERRIGFADLEGNRQYITLGNLADNPRAFIFLMDYANQQRLKLWGRARVIEDDAALIAQLAEDVSYAKTPKRAIVFDIEVWDINCRQHITPRFTEEQLRPGIEKLQARIVELEAENEKLRAN